MITKPILVAALCAACAASGAQSASRDRAEAWRAAIGRDGVQRVRIRCGPDFFDPRVIVVRAGVPLEVSVSTTRGLAAHRFTIAGQEHGAGNPVGPVSTTVAFIPVNPGDYPMACQDDSGIPNRAKQGILTVIP